ncbi:recombinase family protein [Micromonospora sp. KC213]|uniref:recombinase family protein n=1 Tax=Micromonospora sp. KC213 TaxID=2530378 RepID=UPI0010433998|nr:recombinase family protein [Micromonospora sp. KC213]TDC33107.1 recombinase family protein [Micromonospora sp. KC213]
MSRPLASVPDRPGRVLLYARVSALMGRGGDDFHSPDVQVSAMRRATVGMREVGVVQDIDVSGTHFAREGIDRIRAMAEARQIDAIAVYDVSRFGRNVLESLLFLRELSQLGVTIISACEHIDTSTPAGEMMLINLLNIAQYRSREIGRGWSATIARRAERGRHHGRVPAGYQRGPSGQLVPDPVLGPVVAQVFRDYAAGALVRELRRRLQVATGNPKLATNSMKRMLANRTYLGIVHSRGAGGVVETPNAHDPLVDDVTWRRVQDRIAADRKVHPRVLSAKYSLSGLGRCDVCKGHTNIRPHRTGPGIYCRGQFESTSPCSGCGHLRLVDVEDAVVAAVRRRIEQLRGNVAARAAHIAKAARAGADAETLRREIDATRKAKARTTQRWAREQMDDRTYEDTMADLQAAEDQLLATLAQARTTADTPPPDQVVSLAEKLIELWPHMDGGQRNRALRDVLVKVWIRPAAYYRQPAAGRVEVEWR